jgi:hypothetical protein
MEWSYCRTNRDIERLARFPSVGGSLQPLTEYKIIGRKEGARPPAMCRKGEVRISSGSRLSRFPRGEFENNFSTKGDWL